MEYSKNLAYKWNIYLNSCGFSYQIDTAEGVLMIPDVKISNSLEKVTVYIECGESNFRIWCVYNQHVPVSNRDKMANLLTRINCDIYFGRFFMDYSNGKMGFEYTVDFEGSVVSVKMLKNALNIVVLAAKSWGDAMLEVSNGKLLPAQAYSKYR